MYKIQNQNGQTEILLYSLISEGITASQVISALPAEGAITLRINSDGGDIFEAIGLYNYLKGREVYVVIDGLCASAASVVAMCGRKITMCTGSMMMLHRPLSNVFGNADDMRSAANILDKVTESIKDIYVSRTQNSREVVEKFMNDSVWLTAEEALAYRFCDEIEDVPPPSPALAQKTYEDGVIAERTRLRALDELSAPGRERILARAKYETLQSVNDVAVELLKNERFAVHGVSALTPPKEDAVMSMMIDQINMKRGR